MKLSKHLFVTKIIEAIGSGSDGLSNEEREEYFKKVMDLVQQDATRVHQAWDLIPYVNFNKWQMEAIRDTAIETILNDSMEPGPDLQMIGFDFNKIYKNLMGINLPEGEFEMKNGEFILDANPGGHKMGFEFYFDAQGPDGIDIEPIFHFKSPLEPYAGYAGMHPDGGLIFSAGSTNDFGGDQIIISKEELPGRLRKVMGFGPDEDVPGWPGLPKGKAPMTETINRQYLFKLINEVLREEEDDEEKTPLELISSKLDGVLETKNWGHYVQFFDFIDTFEGSGLISKDEANNLRDPVWAAIFMEKIYNEDNFDEIVEAFNNQPNLPKEIKRNISHSIYYFGSFSMGEEWALNYISKQFGAKLEVYDPENLYEFSGVDGDTLEKIKELLIEFGEEEKFFEVYPETGGLMFGVLAQPYVNFERKIEEIFGATPIGDPMMAGGAYQTVSMSESIDEPFDAPMVKGSQVTADIMFEWHPDTEYGMEITLIPTKLGTMPQTLLQDYYGIWVSTAQEGPNIGKLEIGIQNYEDEFADSKLVQNKNGTYGFTVDEMKSKIKEITGINLNEVG